MDKIQIILVDDNEDSLDIMEFYIHQLSHFTIVDKCKLIDAIMRSNPDVILLDINMPKLNGIEAIRTCLKIKSDLLFIFITSYDEYAVQAFELSALDYIVKPIEKARLYAALEKVNKVRKKGKNDQEQQSVDPNQRLIIKEGLDYYFIPVKDIIFIEKVMKKCHIHTLEKTYVTNENIGQLLKKLPADVFFLSHRSYIINLSKLSHVVAKNQTYHAFFLNTNKYAHVSKLKIDELQGKIT